MCVCVCVGMSALDLVPMDTDNYAFGDVVRVWLCVCVCVCVYLCVYACVCRHKCCGFGAYRYR